MKKSISSNTAEEEAERERERERESAREQERERERAVMIPTGCEAPASEENTQG